LEEHALVYPYVEPLRYETEVLEHILHLHQLVEVGYASGLFYGRLLALFHLLFPPSVYTQIQADFDALAFSHGIIPDLGGEVISQHPNHLACSGVTFKKEV
jgi:hypothetical protein